MEQYLTQSRKETIMKNNGQGEPELRSVFQDLLESFQKNPCSPMYDYGVQTERPYYGKLENKLIHDRIMEVGALYRRAMELLEMDKLSMVAEGMDKVVKDYLHKLYGMVADMSTKSKITGEDGREQDTLSLRWALLWSRLVITHLSYVVNILTAVRNLPANEIIDTLIQYLAHGNPELSQMSTRIHSGASESLCKMIWLWITMGTLNDPYKEFFVFKNEVYSQNDSWNVKYLLRKEKVPRVLPSDLVKFILEAGSMISFILIYCEQPVSDNRTREYLLSLQNEPHCGLLPLLNGQKTVLHNLIHILCLDYSKEILNVLKEHNLTKYLKGLYWYVFLALGNFGKYLLEQIYPFYYTKVEYLEIKPIKTLLRRSVIATSPYRRMKEKNAEAKFVTGNWKYIVKNDKICDILQISYDRGDPITKIFSHFETFHEKLHTIVWKMQHIQYSLSYQRKTLMNLGKLTFKNKKTSKNWLGIFKLISPLSQLVNHINFYIMNNIIETEWLHFWKIYQQAQTIDEVTVSYGKLLSNVLYKIRDNEEMNIYLNSIHSLIIESEQLVEQMEQSLLFQNATTNTDEFEAATIILQENVYETMSSLLKDLSNGNNEELKFVCDQINFNHYF